MAQSIEGLRRHDARQRTVDAASLSGPGAYHVRIFLRRDRLHHPGFAGAGHGALAIRERGPNRHDRRGHDFRPVRRRGRAGGIYRPVRPQGGLSGRRSPLWPWRRSPPLSRPTRHGSRSDASSLGSGSARLSRSASPMPANMRPSKSAAGSPPSCSLIGGACVWPIGTLFALGFRRSDRLARHLDRDRRVRVGDLPSALLAPGIAALARHPRPGKARPRSPRAHGAGTPSRPANLVHGRGRRHPQRPDGRSCSANIASASSRGWSGSWRSSVSPSASAAGCPTSWPIKRLHHRQVADLRLRHAPLAFP